MENICECGHYISDHDGYGCTRLCNCYKVFETREKNNVLYESSKLIAYPI